MTPSNRPTDAQLQLMGILCVDTMLPPSPSMLTAGAAAMKKGLMKGDGMNVLVEKMFAAMVLDGLEDLEKLGKTFTPASLAKPSTRAKPSQLAGLHKEFCGCAQCKAWLWGGSGATVNAENAPALVAASAGLLSHAASERVLERSDPQVSKKEPRGQLLKQEALEPTEEEEEAWRTVRSTGATVRPIPPGIQDSNTGDYATNYNKEGTQ